MLQNVVRQVERIVGIINNIIKMGKLILLIGILLVGLVSIETLMYYNNVFDSLDKSSELFFILENIQFFQPFFIFLTLVIYYFVTPFETDKFKHYYDEPKMLGSKKFRKTVRIFIFIQVYIFGDNFFKAGGLSGNEKAVLSLFTVILFGLLLILISRLIQKSSELSVKENTNKKIN